MVRLPIRSQCPASQRCQGVACVICASWTRGSQVSIKKDETRLSMQSGKPLNYYLRICGIRVGPKPVARREADVARILMYLLLFGASAWVQGQPAANLIVTHANIYTVDREHPKAEAVAVIEDRI